MKHLSKVDLSSCIRLTDLSGLTGAYSVRLVGCVGLQTNAFQCLSHVRKLDVSFCPGVTDTRPFANVHTLVLNSCPITDVSSLGSVHSLSLTNCTLLHDVSALRNCHYLNLTNCTGITNVSSLSSVHTLRGASTINGADHIQQSARWGELRRTQNTVEKEGKTGRVRYTLAKMINDQWIDDQRSRSVV